MRDDSIPLDLIRSHSLLSLQTNQRTVNQSKQSLTIIRCSVKPLASRGSRLVTEIDCSCSDFHPIKNFIQTDYPRVSRNPTRWSRGTKTLGTRLRGSRLVTEIDCSCSDFQPIKNFIQTDYPRVSRNPTRWSRGTKTLGTRLPTINHWGTMCAGHAQFGNYCR